MKLYLKKLSQSLDLSSDEIKKLLLLADVHDIGLISVPKEIMNKLEPLDKSDWEEIKRHPATGYRIAKAIPELSDIAYNILYHHERYDGSGYPHELAGKDIPYINRIFSIVDVYEALSQDKLYRTSFSKEEIMETMNRNKGTTFDPSILDLFLNILNKENNF